MATVTPPSKYVALLRGINAGAQRRVPMAELRQVVESLGGRQVSTYINSGNVIYEHEAGIAQAEFAAALEKRFGFAVDVLILTAQQIIATANAIPPEWQNDYSQHKSDVCYLFPEIDSPEIITKVGYRPDVETLLYTKGALLSNLPRKNQPRSSLARLIGTPLYQQMTVRNITTARKLAELCKE